MNTHRQQEDNINPELNQDLIDASKQFDDYKDTADVDIKDVKEIGLDIKDSQSSANKLLDKSIQLLEEAKEGTEQVLELLNGIAEFNEDGTSIVIEGLIKTIEQNDHDYVERMGQHFKAITGQTNVVIAAEVNTNVAFENTDINLANANVAIGQTDSAMVGSSG